MQRVTEHSSTILLPKVEKEVHKKMPVFYNPKMRSNRNISLLLLKALPQTHLRVMLPLAGSGIRGLRFLHETPEQKIEHLLVNDSKENFPEQFRMNLKENSLTENKITILNQDASLSLLNQQEALHFIEVDPWGSPNPFLSAAVSAISREGILAITATDTAALTGTYPKATQRKYWATIQKNHLMHELALRILIRKVQLQAIQFNKALTPLLAYYKDHYYKIFFVSSFGKEKASAIAAQHNYFLYNPKTTEWETSAFNKKQPWQFFGPLWTGQLQNKELLKKMFTINPFPEETKFLQLLIEERDSVGFYDLDILGKKLKLTHLPKMSDALSVLSATRTHFSRSGIKTNNSFKSVLHFLQCGQTNTRAKKNIA